MRDRKLIICALLSIAGHLAFAQGLSHLPGHADPPVKRTVSIRVVAPPPPPLEPPPEPVRAPEAKPTPVPHERARARPAPTVAPQTPPPEMPPPAAATAGDATGPVFGVTMESTSQAGSGPAMPVGRAMQPAVRREVQPSATNGVVPVPAYEVTTMPLPQGRCQGKYTEDAKAAAVEGTVVLDLIIDETGRVRDVRVVSGLGHGLTEAAVAAAKDCRFSPGEKQGTAVPVRVRGFKIRFVMQEND